MKKIIITVLLLLTCFFIYEGYQIYTDLEKKTVDLEQIKKEENKLHDYDVKNSMFANYYDKAISKVEKMTIEEKVGQLFLVRYRKEDVEYLSNFYPGGYILFAKDFENHTKDSIKKELKEANKINKYPLIIGVDEEGGFVTRVSRFKEFREERFKSPREYYQEGGYELLEKTENEKLQLLKELGINLNLAPVADVSTDPNDFIYNRTFGEDANKTSEYIKNMVKYANKNEINSCLKHFPGYGNNKDTHTGIAIDERTYETFTKEDFLPFSAGIKEKVPSILVSHNIVKCMDEKYPASLSENVIKELRKTLGFTGIIMTDDLAMDAVLSYVENNEAATLAINAGNDMVITSDFINMYNEVLKSVKENKINEEKINKAVIRIMAWKYYSNIM